MKAILQKALENSMTYHEYRVLIDDLITQDKSTGDEQSDFLFEFTKLNQQRMKRLDKTQELVPNIIAEIQGITKKQYWFLLTESWCGDAAQGVPILNKMAQLNSYIDLRIVLRDANDELMQNYLTNGGRSIPKLVVFSDDLENELFTWGPRPATAQVEVKRLLEENGGFNEKVKEAIQIWYNKDKGISMQNEMIQLLKNAAI